MVKSIFEKIADRELPAFVVWEDDQFIAFLTIEPFNEGHTLVVPKKNWGDELFELEDDHYQDLLTASKKVATLLKEKLKKERVIMAVEGFQVPHVHVHLIPANPSEGMRSLTPHHAENSELEAVLAKLR